MRQVGLAGVVRGSTVRTTIPDPRHKHLPVLPYWQGVRNRLIAARRAPVEAVFSALKRIYGRARAVIYSVPTRAICSPSWARTTCAGPAGWPAPERPRPDRLARAPQGRTAHAWAAAERTPFLDLAPRPAPGTRPGRAQALKTVLMLFRRRIGWTASICRRICRCRCLGASPISPDRGLNPCSPACIYADARAAAATSARAAPCASGRTCLCDHTIERLWARLKV